MFVIVYTNLGHKYCREIVRLVRVVDGAVFHHVVSQLYGTKLLQAKSQDFKKTIERLTYGCQPFEKILSQVQTALKKILSIYLPNYFHTNF